MKKYMLGLGLLVTGASLAFLGCADMGEEDYDDGYGEVQQGGRVENQIVKPGRRRFGSQVSYSDCTFANANTGTSCWAAGCWAHMSQCSISDPNASLVGECTMAWGYPICN